MSVRECPTCGAALEYRREGWGMVGEGPRRDVKHWGCPKCDARPLNAAPDAGDVEALARDMFATYCNDFHGPIVEEGTMGVMRLLARGVARRYANRESTLRAENERLHGLLQQSLDDSDYLGESGHPGMPIGLYSEIQDALKERD